MTTINNSLFFMISQQVESQAGGPPHQHKTIISASVSTLATFEYGILAGVVGSYHTKTLENAVYNRNMQRD